VEITELPCDHPDVLALVHRLQAEYVRIFGAPDTDRTDPAQFAPPAGAFLLGRAGGEPVAMGGWRRLDAERAELKRMYVPDEHRGRGYARELLHRLEASAAAAGARRVVLETNVRHPAALGLYRSESYYDIPDFGAHAGTPGTRSLAHDLPRS